MNRHVTRRMLSLGAMLASLTALPLAAEEPELPYQYSEEWSVVSAPGPSGPYQPVNIDPRVPGSVVPALPPPVADVAPAPEVAEPAAPADVAAISEPLPDIEADTLENPPAAGNVDMPSAVPDSPAAAATRHQPPVPGYYQPVVPPAPAYGYPRPGGYPVQVWSQGYRGMPPSGYYRAPAEASREHEIPPPPVYEEIQRRSGSHQRPR